MNKDHQSFDSWVLLEDFFYRRSRFQSIDLDVENAMERSLI